MRIEDLHWSTLSSSKDFRLTFGFDLARQSNWVFVSNCFAVDAAADVVVVVVEVVAVVVVVVEICLERAKKICWTRMRPVGLAEESRWRRGGRSCRCGQT